MQCRNYGLWQHDRTATVDCVKEKLQPRPWISDAAGRKRLHACGSPTPAM